MDKNKRVIKKVLATALSLNMVTVFLSISEEKNLVSAWHLFGKNYSKEEIDFIYEENFRQIDEGFELVKGLDDPDEAQSFIKKFQSIRRDLNRDDKRSYDSGASLKKEIEELKRAVEESLELQQIKVKDKKKSLGKKVSLMMNDARERIENSDNLENLNRKAEKIKNSIEQMEDLVEVDEIEVSIENLQAETKTTLEKEEKVRQLNSKLDSIMKDASKKIENSENMDHINSMAAELREEIQQIDNLNKVSGIEVLFGDLQAEIETTLEKEEKVRQLNSELDSIIKGASENIENPENMDRINSMAAELRERIQQIDNLNRVSEVEVLLEELRTEITNILKKEDTIRQENLRRSLEEAKAGLSQDIENLQDLLSDLDEENENCADFEIIITSYRELFDQMETLEEAAQLKEECEAATARLNALLEQQSKIEKEKKAKEELETQIEMFHDPEGQMEMLKEGKISFDDVIGGNKKAKAKILELVKAFEKYNNGGKIAPSKGILLYGPPGTGKTSLIEAFAAAHGIELFIITPSLVMGENGERKMLETLELAKKAAQISGKLVMVLIDEIDAICQNRDSNSSNPILVALMNWIDNLTARDNVLIVATTNRREAIDKAIIRSGRLEKSVEVGHPNSDDKKEILKIRLKYLRLADEVEESINSLIDKTRGFSGADIKRISDIAIESAMEIQNVEKFTEIIIKMADIQKGIATVMDEKTSIY